jgi:Zn-dependent peptidase ImmA (M78 family)
MTPPSQQASVVGQLRALIPQRRLHFSEALRLAELQANRFRELHDHAQPDLPEDVIARLPRLIVTREADLPVSGLAQWHNGRWIVALNATEPEVRQRFSLAHELFHIINHTTKEWLHPGDGYFSPHESGEKLADYFAGCLLMPKRYIKSLVGYGFTPAQLADTFGVSVRAVQVRLAQLGITEPLPRCIRPVNSYRRVVKPYTRRLHGAEGVPA